MTEFAQAASGVVRVWDVPVRIVHWTIVALLGFSWYSAENDLMDWHRLSGYAVLGLLLFRILWGFVGSSTARFTGFVRSPRTIARYAGTLHQRKPSEAVGHNPLGGISVLALMLTMAVQTGTGLFAVDVDGVESGPLSDRVSFDQGRWLAELHHTSFTVLQLLVLLHIVAIAFYFLYKRDNLIGPMISGRRRTAEAGLKPVSVLRIFAAALVSIVAVWIVSQGARFWRDKGGIRDQSKVLLPGDPGRQSNVPRAPGCANLSLGDVIKSLINP